MAKRELRPVTASEWRRLTRAALAARRNAHAPYSKFRVGAALLAEGGRVFVGCNVENASYGLTVCAERNAVGSAVAAGARRFRALVVASPSGVTPCGACRQVLMEFAPAMPVRLVSPRGKTCEMTVAEMLPGAFGAKDLKRGAGS
jgi:cytidine deaminase